jgi:hypothetical protein
VCAFDDGEQADIWREDVRTVMRPRKQRECSGCGAVIGAGEPFVDHFDLYDGNANSEAGCFACWWTRELFADDHGGMRYPFGMLMEQLEQCIGENMRRVYRDGSSWPGTSWECVEWKAAGGYAAAAGNTENASRERIWFSPHCELVERQGDLFSAPNGRVA